MHTLYNSPAFENTISTMEEIPTKDLEYLKLNLKEVRMAIFYDLISEFQIIDYSPTHNQLLIRSMKNRNRGYNIDIIVKGVWSILILSLFKGLEISIFEISENKRYLVDDYGFKITNEYRIFSLKNSEGMIYFLNALCFGVYHNKLDNLETSIGRYDIENFGENILWYAD